MRPVRRGRRSGLQRAPHSGALGRHAGGRAVSNESQEAVQGRRRNPVQPSRSRGVTFARFHSHNARFLQVSWLECFAGVLLWKVI